MATDLCMAISVTRSNFVPQNGQWVYYQLHMKSQQGAKFITQEDSVNYSPDYSQKDLYEAIERGEYPKWSVEIQTMTPKEAEELWEKQKINVFDLTHIWPQKQFPRRKVGKFVLNENAINYFAEIEQAAFSPSHMPPGIEPSADPVLQSRLFSYSDTHCHRIGVNYQQLPVNAPRTGFKTGNFRRDGQMALYNQGARPNYLSSIESIQFRERTVNLDKTHSHFVGEAITSSLRSDRKTSMHHELYRRRSSTTQQRRASSTMSLGRWRFVPTRRFLSARLPYSEKFTPTLPRALRRLLVSRVTTKFLKCSSTALTMEW